MKIESTQNSETRFVGNVKVEESDIIEMLKTKGIVPKEIPSKSIKVAFNVPGGGDYSNTSLKIEDYLEVSWDHVGTIGS